MFVVCSSGYEFAFPLYLIILITASRQVTYYLPLVTGASSTTKRGAEAFQRVLITRCCYGRTILGQQLNQNGQQPHQVVGARLLMCVLLLSKFWLKLTDVKRHCRKVRHLSTT